MSPHSQTVRAAWIGLGVMGFPMAGYLVTRGGLAVREVPVVMLARAHGASTIGAVPW